MGLPKASAKSLDGRSGADRTGAMAPSTLDLLMLTFNCAKNLINVGIFANHLQTALSQNATGLPELVVFSLQEFAPMSHSFIGGCMINPYYARYESALNIAALHRDDERQRQQRQENGDVVSVTPTAADQPKKPYSLVRAGNVGYTGILLFARDPTRLSEVQIAEVGFGAADMGNKGAVGLRTTYTLPSTGEETELTFVATHLAAMEWNLPRRNANWAAIMRGLTFENPETVLTSFKNHQRDSEEDGERTRLLSDEHMEHEERNLQLQRAIHDLSVFKPSSHLFVAGDLNYRISTTSPGVGATFPSLDPGSPEHYPVFLPLDQLTRERRAGRALHGMSEAPITFPPTYKYDVKPACGGKADGGVEDVVEWSFAPHRYPAWTDRVLYLDVPPWIGGGGTKKNKKEVEGASKIQVLAYDALPVIRTSDHRPVYLRAAVPLIAPADLAPPADLLLQEQHGGGSGSGSHSILADPRARLPIEIDPEAWDRRRAARRREVALGCGMYLWSTKEGAVILATLTALGVGLYWLAKGPGA